MGLSDVRDGWLLLGQSQKPAGPFSPGGRRKIGEKGLGRLAALRLGSTATLTTRQSGADMPGPASAEHSVTLNWAAFDNATAVEDVPLDLVSRPCAPGSNSGTVIRIDGLHQPLTPAHVQRLARALVLLNGAFPVQNMFRATLDAPEFDALAKLVAEGYFDQNEYQVVAEVDGHGRASATMIDWRGTTMATADHAKIASRSPDPDAPYACPPAAFELWAFVLSGENFKLRNSTRTLSEVRAWIKEVGGVHLFQRGLRVHPYGDEGQDWLELNLRRVRSPEGRPGTNTSVGRVVVDDDRGMLVPKTDRSGFVENTAFLEVKRFCSDVLEWAADRQVEARDRNAHRKVARVQRRKAKATAKVKRELAALPIRVRESVEEAIHKYEEAAEEELKLVVDELALYRTLSTVGTTTAVFAHESVRPLAIIESMVDAIADQLRHDLPGKAGSWYTEPIALTSAAASSLRTFAQLPLRLLDADKRQPGVVDISDRISRLLPLFSYYLKEATVELHEDLATDVTVRATVSEIEAIVANLLANAVHFLSVGPTRDGGPKQVLIETELVDEDHVSLTVADNGPGIRGIDPEDVWLPGRTTRDGGTGLGLTIVRDVVAELAGRRDAVANGRLGGAEFTLTLPRTLATEAEQLNLDDL
jgi:signal transduction histidine kinase